MLSKLLELIAALFDFIRDRQLINAGKAEAEKNVHEASTEAVKQVEKTIVDIDSLSNHDLRERLSKWRRKE